MLAISAISILLTHSLIVVPVHAYTITQVAFGGTGVSNEWRDCKYLTTTGDLQTWCPTTTGIKVWNPTTRTVTATLYNGVSINDIECGILCYSWDVVSAGVANLTSWSKSAGAFNKVNTTLFTLNAGGQVGHSMGLATGAGSQTLLLPIEGQVCKNSAGTPLGNADEKGICIFDGVAWAGSRFISDGSTNDLDVNYDVIWNGQSQTISDPTANRMVVKNRDLSGNFRFFLIDLSDGDTTFALTKKCDTGITTGTQQSRMFMINGIMYDSDTAQGIKNIITTGSSPTCGVFTKSAILGQTTSFRSIAYSSTDNIYIVNSDRDNGGTVESEINVFNGTGFAGSTSANKLLTINTTSSVTTDFSWTLFLHPSEGEVHLWKGDKMYIITGVISATGSSQSSGATVCIDTDLNGTADLCFNDTNGDGIADNGQLGSLGAYRSNANLTQFGSDVFCAFGINQSACTNKNIKTNGVGVTYLILLIIISYAFLVFIHYNAQKALRGSSIQVMDALSINPMLLIVMLFLDVGVAWYLAWIDGIIFYTIIAVLAGFTAFGLYKRSQSAGE